jgi:hypothetical protein
MQDGSVVTWGDANCGGNSRAVQAQMMEGVDMIYSTGSAFAVVKRDGSVVIWGHAFSGGDSSYVQEYFKQDTDYITSCLQAHMIESIAHLTIEYLQVTIYSTDEAFAAVKRDGSVVGEINLCKVWILFTQLRLRLQLLRLMGVW